MNKQRKKTVKTKLIQLSFVQDILDGDRTFIGTDTQKILDTDIFQDQCQCHQKLWRSPKAETRTKVSLQQRKYGNFQLVFAMKGWGGLAFH